jgi:hypothetical protein
MLVLHCLFELNELFLPCLKCAEKLVELVDFSFIPPKMLPQLLVVLATKHSLDKITAKLVTETEAKIA